MFLSGRQNLLDVSCDTPEPEGEWDHSGDIQTVTNHGDGIAAITVAPPPQPSYPPPSIPDDANVVDDSGSIASHTYSVFLSENDDEEICVDPAVV